MTRARKTLLAMTKIVVTDLERCETFYRQVCGFDQIERIEGDGFREILMRPSGDPAGAVLVLFCDGSSPPPGEAVLVFDTPDIIAFCDRVTACGGVITHPVQTLTDMGLSFAMFQDPEGHVIEAIARHATSSPQPSAQDQN